MKLESVGKGDTIIPIEDSNVCLLPYESPYVT